MKKITLKYLLLGLLVIASNTIDAQNYFTQNTTNGLPTGTVVFFDIGDLENDGDLDIIISDYNKVSIYTNNGSGSFSLLSGVSFSSITYDGGNPKFIDIDNDNDLDVVIINDDYLGKPPSQLYRNDGGSTFTQIVSFPAAGMYSVEMAVGDYNGDNLQDLLVTGSQSSGSKDAYTAFLNDGNGNLNATLLPLTSQYLIPWANGSGQIITLANMNGSGADDLILTTGGPDWDLNMYQNGSLAATTLLEGYASSPDNENHIVADIDGDGDNDVIGAQSTTTNHILLNDGAGNFTQSSQTIQGGKDRGLIAAGDIDNDGDIDILRKGRDAAGTGYMGGLFINDSNGNFYLNNGLTLPDAAFAISKLVDMNGDNYPELIIANQSTATLHYYDNTFTTNHPDKALDFDGTNHYTTSHEAALNTLPITIEFSIQDGSGTNAGILKKMTGDNGFQVGLIAGRVTADYKTDASNFAYLNQAFLISDGSWHHVAVVVESTGMKLYGDGVLISSTAWTGIASSISNTVGLELGKWVLSSSAIFSGNLDEVRIWNTARTHADIINNMCGKISNPSSEASLVAYYSMDDYVTGNNVMLDNSSKSKTMTITGGSQALAAEQTGCTAPALPVELTYFKGQATDNGNLLQWQTASEKYNFGFEIESSENGENWKNIGFVHGNGTTVEISNYEFIDRNRVGLYYRLKQIDFDGKYQYSNIVNIQTTENSGQAIKTFPNPITDFITIENRAAGEIAQIIDLNGRIIQEYQLQETSSQYPVSGLPNGIYFLKINQDRQTIIIQR